MISATLRTPDMAKVFARLDDKIQKKATKEAVRVAGQILVREVKARVPVDTGTAKKAIGVKNKTYRSKKHVGIVGARVGFKREITRTIIKRGKVIKVRVKSKRVKTAEKGTETKDAACTLHLAEGGRKPVQAKKKKLRIASHDEMAFVREARAARGRRFMASALDAAKPAMAAAMINVLQSHTTAAISAASGG